MYCTIFDECGYLGKDSMGRGRTYIVITVATVMRLN